MLCCLLDYGLVELDQVHGSVVTHVPTENHILIEVSSVDERAWLPCFANVLVEVMLPYAEPASARTRM